MTDPSTGGSSFSSYYDKYRSQFGGAQASSGEIDFSQYSNLFAKAPNKMGFLGRFVDILSRPMRIISNPVMKAVELPERFDTAKELRAAGDDAAATKESLNAVGSLLAAPFTGFFSDDPSNKPYWSDIIERQVDITNRNDPNYVNVANNADPKVKGAFGFVGDVLIDPLWLVPGGWALKAAKESKRGVDFSKGIIEAENVPAAVARGAIPEAAMLPSLSGARNLSVSESVLARTAPSRTTFDLIVDGKTIPQKFSTKTAAEEFLETIRAKSKRPLVNVDEVPQVFRGSRGYKIAPSTGAVADVFPSAQAAQKVSDDLINNAARGAATSSETVIKSLREIIDSKMVSVGGKTAPLKGELGSFFESLSKITAKAAPAVKAGKPKTFDSWVPALEKESKLSNARIAIPEGSSLSAPFGRQATVKNILSVYRNTRDAAIKADIERLILRPAHARYTAGLKAGKDVDFIGNAATPTALMQEAAEASVAATIVRNLKNLDDAERARGAALLGEELFADLQGFDPKGMTRFLDEIDVVLYQTGALDAFTPTSNQALLGRFLNLFDVDQATRSAAVAQVAKSVDDIPNVTPESTLGAAKKVSESVTVEDDIVRALTDLGYPADKINLRGGVGREKSLFGVILETLQSVLPAVTAKKIAPNFDEYKHVSRTGVRNTEPEYGQGVGVILNEPSTYFQFDLFVNVAKYIDANFFREGTAGPLVLRDLKGKPFIGAKLAAEKERIILAAMKVAEQFYLNRGVSLTFDLNGIHSSMRFSEAYEAVAATLRNTNKGDNWLRLVFFNGNSGMPPTQFMEAVSSVLAGGSRADVKALLAAKKDSRTGKNLTKINFLARPNEVARMSPGNFKSSTALDNLTDAIFDSKDVFESMAKSNAEKYVGLSVEQSKVITPAVADVLMTLMNSPTDLAAAIKAVAYSGAVTTDFAKTINATQLAATLSAGAVKSGLGENLTTTAKLVDDIASAASAGSPERVAKAQAALGKNSSEAYKRMMADASRVVDDLQSGKNPYSQYIDDVVDELDASSVRPHDAFSTEGRGSVAAMALKLINPLSRVFNAKHGMHTDEMLWGARLFFGSGNKAAYLSKPFLKSFKDLLRVKEYQQPVVPGGKTKVFEQAFKNVQAGTRSAEGTVLRKAEDDIRPMLSRFFDQTDDLQKVILGNAFFRTGAGREAMNDIFEYNSVLGKSGAAAKLPPNGVFFDYDLAIKTATEKLAKKNADIVAQGGKATQKAPTQEEITAEMLNQWRTWDVERPFDFMYAVNRAMVQMSTEVSFVTLFKQKVFELNLGGTVPQKGFVKLVFDGDSRYGKYLGDQPFYVDRDVAEMFQAIDNFAKSSKQFEGGFGKFTRTVIDPLTDTWKYAVTLPRLGHHIRNGVGDVTLTYLAEGIVGSVPAAKQAWQLMAFKGEYPDIDIAKALLRQGITDVPKNNTVISKGQLGSFTAQDIFDKLLLDRGILIPARQREGLLNQQRAASDTGLLDEDVMVTTASRVLEKTFAVTSIGAAARGGKVEDAILWVAESRDTWVRIHHAMQMLEKAQRGMKLTRGYGTVVDPKKLSLDELFDVIAERVSKYHPDMATLSVAEKKYLRRIMPFYHWNRGAIQAVTETLLMNPGRVVAFNKAYYNIAIAAGIEPDSMFDPFPDDQLFPSFLQDQMEGPLFEAGGRYFGLRPGIATFDVLNQFASGNPIDTVLDNANPMFKIPIELLTGTRLGTQSRIRDYSDYLDSSIPGFNYGANVSGQSITGSFYSLLTGGGFDPQYQFEIGNKDSRDQIISAVNWLLGIGLTDYSRPSYIRFAEQERQREQGEQRGF